MVNKTSKAMHKY